jgi:hypothetical protein
MLYLYVFVTLIQDSVFYVLFVYVISTLPFYLRNRKTNCYKTENAENEFAAKQKTN